MAVGAALALVACKEGQAAEGAQDMVVPVKIASLAAAPTEQYAEYMGTVRSRRSVEVRPQVEGYVARILVKPGEAVGAGAQLVQIDPKRTPSSRPRAKQQRRGCARS